MRRKVFRLVSVGGVGDAILTTPAFQAIKKAHPSCKIMVYCKNPTQLGIYRNNPYIDGCKMADFKSSPIQGIKYLCQKYLYQRRLFYRNNYAQYRASLIYIGHTSEIIAEMLGVKLTDRTPQIYLTEGEESAAKNFLKDYSNPVVIHADPLYTQNKAWPPENWAALVKLAPEVTFLQIGHKDEARIPGAVSLLGKTSLRQALSIIKQAHCFVGVESGMAHAAAAFGTPGVTLFGPTNPEFWGHPTNINLYLGLRCSPCIDILKREDCPYGKPCMSGISANDVASALQKQLSLAASARFSAADPHLRSHSGPDHVK